MSFPFVSFQSRFVTYLLTFTRRNDQLDATITNLLIFESAQNVSSNHLPIFRSVRQ